MRSRRVSMTWGVALLAATAAFASGRSALAADPAEDSAVARAIVGTINQGVPLYNAGDHYGCYRLYQGLAIGLSVSGREGLGPIMSAGLTKAEAQNRYDLRATALREALDKGLSVVSGGGAGGAMAKKPLWDRLGGEASVSAVIHDFVGLAAGDPRVDFTRGGKYKFDAESIAGLERKLVELVSAVSGGPLKYTGGAMKPVHEGMGITDAQFDALAGDLITVLKKYNVPKAEADELVAAVASTRKEMVEVRGGAAPPAPRIPSPPLPSGSMPAAKKTLFERLGGHAAVVAVVDDFVARAAGDPKVNFTRKGTPAEWPATPDNVAHLKTLLVQLIESTTGGGTAYTGRSMKESHKGMGITEAEFGALAADLKATLDKFKVPAQEQGELFKIIGSTKADIVETP